MTSASPLKVLDLRLRSPATVMIAGPTGCGKTQLLVDLINQADTICTRAPKKIVYCYGMWQKAFEGMNGVHFHQGFLDVEEEFEQTDGENKWLIIDDLMHEVTKNNQLDAIFTKLSHHLDLTVFLVVQNLFLKPLRTASVNTHYFFLGKNPRDVSSITNFAKQMTPGNTGFFVEAYADATHEPHSFLFVSVRQETEDEVRLIKNFGRPGKLMVSYVTHDSK